MSRKSASLARLVVAASAFMISALTTHSIQALSVGERAPAFTGASLIDGSRIRLASYRGKVVLVDFWASWCSPCHKSVPQLVELRREMANSPFEIVAVNVDENPEDARKFLADHPIPYAIVTDTKGKIPERYELPDLPTWYLLNKEGVVQYIHAGFSDGDLEKIKLEIEKLLNQ